MTAFSAPEGPPEPEPVAPPARPHLTAIGPTDAPGPAVSRGGSVATPSASSTESVGRIPLLDASLYGILFGNAAALAGVLFEHWPAAPLMWVYWGQSVVIGITNVIRILCLKEFSTEGFTSNGSRVPETVAGKRSTAWFFSMHYGAFHLAYAAFLASRTFGHGEAFSTWMPLTVIGNVGMFAFAHGYSLWKKHGHDTRSSKPNLGSLMFYPYLRIIPMHLAIILGGAFPLGALPFFILLKTGADVGMHLIERKLFVTED